MGHRHEPGVRVEQLAVVLDQKLAAIVDRHHADCCALLFGHHLPRNDIGVMLQRGQDDLVTGLEEFATVPLRHQIDAVGGAAGENALARFFGVDEGLDLEPRLFVFRSRRFRQVVHGAVDIGVLRAAVFHPAINHPLRHLTRCCIIQKNQRLIFDLQAENGKVPAQRRHIQRCREFVARAHRLASVRAITSFSSAATREGTGMWSMISAPKA